MDFDAMLRSFFLGFVKIHILSQPSGMYAAAATFIVR